MRQGQGGPQWPSIDVLYTYVWQLNELTYRSTVSLSTTYATDTMASHLHLLIMKAANWYSFTGQNFTFCLLVDHRLLQWLSLAVTKRLKSILYWKAIVLIEYACFSANTLRYRTKLTVSLHNVVSSLSAPAGPPGCNASYIHLYVCRYLHHTHSHRRSADITRAEVATITSFHTVSNMVKISIYFGC